MNDNAPLSNAQSIFDFVANEILARVAPLRFELALSPAEREPAYRLQFQIMTALCWVKYE